MTLATALTPTDLQAAMTGSGAIIGGIFALCIDQAPGPTPVPGDVGVIGDVVVPDNLLADKKLGSAEVVEARSARQLYLPPHSPGLNPILT